jgi:hypothetical protein
VLPRRYPRGVRPKTRPGIHVPVTGYRFGTCQLAPRPLLELSSRAPSRAGYALLTKSRYCCRGCIRTPKALGVAPFDLRCCAERLYADHCHVPLSPLAPTYSLVLVVRVSFAASQSHYKGFIQIRFLSSPGRPGDPTLLTFCNSC